MNRPCVDSNNLRASLVVALTGHTDGSRDCNLSGEYLTAQIWPLIEPFVARLITEEDIERVARKLAGQYMIDDGYDEQSRVNAENGKMWRNFKEAARVAIEAMLVVPLR